jgi:2'-5' RNA ligase
MRLFVAVDLSAEAVDEAVRVADEIRRRSHAKLRWVPAANMHLTVRFIGHVAGNADQLVSALTAPVALNPFDLALAGCGAFPPAGAIRVVWIGVAAAGVPSLTHLSAVMDERVRSFGFAPDARPFSPHLTLARAERNERVPRQVRETLAHETVRPVRTHVTQAVIYQSHLSPRGARYEAVAAVPFAAESQLD